MLGRLYAETLEEEDPRPRETIEVTGASRVGSLLYGSLPVGASRLISLGLYRWEVTVRETIAVGVVGAAGLGRWRDPNWIDQQRRWVHKGVPPLARGA